MRCTSLMRVSSVMSPPTCKAPVLVIAPPAVKATVPAALRLPRVRVSTSRTATDAAFEMLSAPLKLLAPVKLTASARATVIVGAAL